MSDLISPPSSAGLTLSNGVLPKLSFASILAP
jgi:hypothetical protein